MDGTTTGGVLEGPSTFNFLLLHDTHAPCVAVTGLDAARELASGLDSMVSRCLGFRRRSNY